MRLIHSSNKHRPTTGSVRGGQLGFVFLPLTSVARYYLIFQFPHQPAIQLGRGNRRLTSWARERAGYLRNHIQVGTCSKLCSLSKWSLNTIIRAHSTAEDRRVITMPATIIRGEVRSRADDVWAGQPRGRDDLDLESKTRWLFLCWLVGCTLSRWWWWQVGLRNSTWERPADRPFVWPPDGIPLPGRGGCKQRWLSGWICWCW